MYLPTELCVNVYRYLLPQGADVRFHKLDDIWRVIKKMEDIKPIGELDEILGIPNICNWH